ncbi:hypothetical protein BVY01_02195 [bacterium I07]|nr:hypothetical protein BVY01_02195 [bacterium I07]
MTMEERLKILETELAETRRRSFRFMYTFGILLSVLVLLVIYLTYTQSKRAVIRADEVRAHRFIVENDREADEGQQQGIFGMIQDSPGLRLGGRNAPQISLSTHSGTYLYLADGTGKPTISMNVVGDRSSLSFFNENRRDLIDIALSWDNPGLILTDEKGKVLWKAP